MFDLVNEPYEVDNVVADKAYKDTLAELKRELQALRIQHNDNFSSFWDGYKD